MYIRQTRIRNIETHARLISAGQIVIPAVPIDELYEGQLSQAGLSDPPIVGESVLPTIVRGPRSITRINVEGSHSIDRTEREPFSQTFEWTHNEFRGADPPEEVTNFASVERWRYRRIPIPAPQQRIEVRSDADGCLWVATVGRPLIEANYQMLVHQVNLLLETFGFCVLLNEELAVPQKLTRVDWEFLPQGQMPWESKLHPLIQSTVAGGTRSRGWNQHRIDLVASYQPDYTAVGRAGMAGYVLFNFADRGVHVLECGRYGNATYVIDAAHDWETVTHLTKAELIGNDYVTDRIVHHATSWDTAINELLGPIGPE